MLDMMFAVAVGVTLGMLLTIVISISLMTNETVVKWYAKKSINMTKAILKVNEELEDELS